jgi:hypothetical protein
MSSEAIEHSADDRRVLLTSLRGAAAGFLERVPFGVCKPEVQRPPPITSKLPVTWAQFHDAWAERLLRSHFDE